MEAIDPRRPYKYKKAFELGNEPDLYRRYKSGRGYSHPRPGQWFVHPEYYGLLVFARAAPAGSQLLQVIPEPAAGARASRCGRRMAPTARPGT